MVQAIAAEMKFEVQPVVAPWAELLRQFRAGEIDVLSNVAYGR